MFVVRQTKTFQRWVEELRDRKAKAAIAARIIRLSEGLTGDVAFVGDGVSELRIHYGPGYRVYFTRRDRMFVLLLCGGDKGGQRRDIETAKCLVQDLRDDDG